jgi:transcriptional regulator with XRE-family HTH domain
MQTKPSSLNRHECDINAIHEKAMNEIAARAVYKLRTSYNLTQRAFAKRVRTTESIICQLETARYAGHLHATLNRIAAALNMRVKISVVPMPKKRRSA